MPRRLALADRLRIKSPCDSSWSTMHEGEDGLRRFCTACDRHVHDASKLTRREVTKLLDARAEGERICFHLHVRRTDGAILLADGHAMPSKGAARTSLALIAAASAIAGCSPQQQPSPSTPQVEIPNQPTPPPTPTALWPEAVIAPEPMRAAEPPQPEPPPEEPPPPPPKPVKPAKAAKPVAPTKATPAHPPAHPTRKIPYDLIDGGAF